MRRQAAGAGALLALGLLLSCETGRDVRPHALLERSGWRCDLGVMEAVEPGDLLREQEGKLVRLPFSLREGIAVERRPTTLAGVEEGSRFRFELGAGLQTLGDLQAMEADFSRAGVRALQMRFTEAEVCALHGEEAFLARLDEARAAVASLLAQLDAEEAPGAPAARVWLVQQTLRARVTWEFVADDQAQGAVRSLIERIRARVGGVRAGRRRLTLTTEQPRSIGWRALPLRLDGGALRLAGSPVLLRPAPEPTARMRARPAITSLLAEPSMDRRGWWPLAP